MVSLLNRKRAVAGLTNFGDLSRAVTRLRLRKYQNPLSFWSATLFSSCVGALFRLSSLSLLLSFFLVAGCSTRVIEADKATEIAVPPMSERQRMIEAHNQLIAENTRLVSELRRRGIDVRDTERGVVVNLPDVLFSHGKADLTPEAITTIVTIASILKLAPARTIAVEGHTDDVGTIDYNYKLSESRGKRVAQELETAGITSATISTRALGETTPIATNRTDEGRATNRRVEIIIENQGDL
jgi:outer membrane protein OmpA-like peptidoglycan-associated protein